MKTGSSLGKALTSIIFIILFFKSPAVSQNIEQKLDSLISFYNIEGSAQNMGSNFSGAILVAQNGKIIFKKAYGKASLTHDVDNTIATKFLIGSVTKTFTSMLIMILMEEEKIALDTKLIEVFPKLKLSGVEKVTIHNLLTHSSGLPQYGHLMDTDSVTGILWRRTMSSKEVSEFLISSMNSVTMTYEAGKKFQYNSLNYVILGLIAEKVANKSFSELIDSKIARPLNLSSTGYASNEVLVKNLAQSYRFNSDSDSKSVTYTYPPYRDRTWEYSSGGIYSNIKDMFKWVQAVKNSTLVTSSSTKKLFTQDIDNYAYGWWVNDPRYSGFDPNLKMKSHLGAVEGYRANLAIMEQGNIDIIILSNVAPLNTRKLTYEIYTLATSQGH